MGLPIVRMRFQGNAGGEALSALFFTSGNLGLQRQVWPFPPVDSTSFSEEPICSVGNLSPATKYCVPQKSSGRPGVGAGAPEESRLVGGCGYDICSGGIRVCYRGERSCAQSMGNHDGIPPYSGQSVRAVQR